MPHSPQLRAGFILDVLTTLDELAPHLAARSLLPAEHAQLRHSAWAPIAWTIAVDRLILEDGGEDALLAVRRRTLARAYEGPLLGPMHAAALKMLGGRPALHCRWLPVGWSIATRGLGHASFAERERGCCMRVAGVPQHLLVDETWQSWARTVLLACVRHIGWDASCSATVENGALAVEVRWWRAPAIAAAAGAPSLPQIGAAPRTRSTSGLG